VKIGIFIGMVINVFFIVEGSTSEPLNISQTLLGTFRSQCPSVVTRHLQGPLGQLQSMIEMVKSLKEGGQCFGSSNMEELLTNYSRISQHYAGYAQTKNSRKDASLAVDRYMRLLLQGDIDDDYREFMQNEIFLTQANLISLEGPFARFSYFSNDKALGAAQILTSAEGMLGNLAANPSCYSKKQSLLGPFLSNILLATSAFTNPGTSLALSTSGILTGVLGRFMHNFNYNKEIGELDQINMPTALRCVSEALTNQYCSADESLDLIDLYRHRDGEERLQSLELQSVALLSTHMKHLSSWLQEVFAGSPTASEGDLVNRQKPINQKELLEKVLRIMNTYGTIRRKIFQDLSDPRARTEGIAIGISKLVQIMFNPSLRPGGRSEGGGVEVENPIFVSRSGELLAFRLYNPALPEIPNCQIEGGQAEKCASLADYIRDQNIDLTIEGDWDRALLNALNVVQETLDQVNIDRSRTVSVDSYSVLVSANRDFKGETNALSALEKISESATRIAEYLTHAGCGESNEHCDSSESGYSPRLSHRYFPQITNTMKTRELTNDIIGLVREGFRPGILEEERLPQTCRGEASSSNAKRLGNDSGEDKAFRITSCITKILKLADRGNEVYFRKIRDMVNYELEARFLNGDFADGVRETLYATRADLVESLISTYNQGNGQTSLQQISTGLEVSMNTSKHSYFRFMKFFEYALFAAFERDLTKGERADLCFKILPYLDEENQEFMQKAYHSCHQVKLNFYRNGPTLSWSDYIRVTERKIDSRRGYHKKGSRPRQYNSTVEKNFSLAKNVSLKKKFCLLKNYHRKNVLIEDFRRYKKRFSH